MKIQNTTRGDRVLPDGGIIPANSDVTMPDEAWQKAAEHPVVKAWLETGELVAAKDAPEGDKSEKGKK